MPVAQANGETLYNVFSLSSEASAQVDNDLMVATLVVQAEDQDPALLASKINLTMSWAVNVLRPYGALKTKTRDYQTYPQYDSGKKRKLIGWRGSQSIQIETDDFQAAGEAIQKLQERLQVQGIQLAAKAETRSSAADALINEALSAFKQRALLIQRNMGATGYRILDVNIQSDQGGAAMYDSRLSGVEMMRSAVVSEPSIEAGTSRVSVQVYGRIQLD
ncbi:MAG: putative secreted protein [Pseudomonadales bacterium]|jgi:predicted secreted protein